MTKKLVSTVRNVDWSLVSLVTSLWNVLVTVSFLMVDLATRCMAAGEKIWGLLSLLVPIFSVWVLYHVSMKAYRDEKDEFVRRL